MSSRLGDFEQLLLLAVVRCGEDAYGVRLRDELEERCGRDVSLGAIYKGLERLATKGFVRSRTSDPTPQRGGRRKRLYRLTAPGEQALRSALSDLRSMTRGLPADWRP